MIEESKSGSVTKDTTPIKKPYRDFLQEKMQHLAEEKIARVLSSAVSRIVDYNPGSLPEESNGMMVDDSLSLESLFELNEVGLLDDVVSVPLNTIEVKTTPLGLTKVERLSQTRFGLEFPRGITFVEQRQRMVARLQNSPVARVFTQLAKEMTDDVSEKPKRTIRFDADPAASAVVLDLMNFFGFSGPTISSVSEINPDAIASENISTKLRDNAKLDEYGNINEVTFNLEEGVVIRLLSTRSVHVDSDLLAVDWNLEIMTDVSSYLLETANQSTESRCEVFINRATGIEFILALERSGLKFAPDFEDFLTTGRSPGFDDRYGGAYSQISRLLAKAIHAKDPGALNEIIVNQMGASPTVKQLELLASLESKDHGFKTFQRVLKDTLILVRDDHINDPSVTKTRVSIRSGACFDVASYYSQALSLGKLKLIEIHGNEYLKKTHGL